MTSGPRDRETGSAFLPAGVSEADIDRLGGEPDEEDRSGDWENGWEVPD